MRKYCVKIWSCTSQYNVLKESLGWYLKSGIRIDVFCDSYEWVSFIMFTQVLYDSDLWSQDATAPATDAGIGSEEDTGGSVNKVCCLISWSHIYKYEHTMAYIRPPIEVMLASIQHCKVHNKYLEFITDWDEKQRDDQHLVLPGDISHQFNWI